MDRIRSKGSLSQPKAWTETWSKTGLVVYSGTGTRVGEVVVMADRTVPKFRKEQGAGKVFFNPMNKVRTVVSDSTGGVSTRVVNPGSSAYNTTYTDTPGVVPYVLKSIGTTYSGTVPRVWSDETIQPIRLSTLPIDRAVFEACTKAGGLPSKANLLVTMAEYRQLMSLAPDLLGSWTRFFRRINDQRSRVPELRLNSQLQQKYQGGKAPVQFLRDQWRDIVQMWLISRFGIRPLVMETMGVLRAIEKLQDQHSRHTSRGSATARDSADYNGVVRFGVGDWQFATSVHNEVHVRAMQLFEGQLTLAKDIGLAISSIPEAAIDLVRFSFVLNWVVNVNDFFRALGRFADPSFKSLGSCYVVDETYSTVWQALGAISNSTSYAIEKQPTGLLSSTIQIKRRVVGITPPKLVVRASPTQWVRDARLLDAVALLDVQLRGRNVRGLAGLSSLGKASGFSTPF